MNDDSIKKSVGLRIKQLRLEHGLTQEDLANTIGSVKGKSSIANYENGANFPSDEVKLKLCKIFNCSLDYLMAQTDIKNPGIVIDDVLNESMIGMSKQEYDALSDNQKEQIRNFAKYIKTIKT